MNKNLDAVIAKLHRKFPTHEVNFRWANPTTPKFEELTGIIVNGKIMQIVPKGNERGELSVTDENFIRFLFSLGERSISIYEKIEQ